jgi:hypothetical protein
MSQRQIENRAQKANFGKLLPTMKSFLLLVVTISLFSCKAERKRDYLNKSNEKGLYYSIPKTYERIYGKVEFITDATYSLWKSKTTPANIKEVLESKIHYSFDKQGNETEIRCYDSDDNLRWRAVNSYNSRALLFTVKYYNNENRLRHIFTYDYDRKGNLISTVDGDQDNPKGVFKSFATIKNGISEEHTVNYKNEVIQKSRISRDEYNNVVKVLVYQPNNDLIFEETYKYDDSNRLTNVLHYDAEKETDTSVYHYYNKDKAGNWRVKFSKEPSSGSSITRRKIEYY